MTNLSFTRRLSTSPVNITNSTFFGNLAGSGGAIDVTLTPGLHTITAQVSSQETSASDSITVLVCQLNLNVSNEAELNAAIGCANSASGGAETITLLGDITLSAAATALNNTSRTTILIEGNGFSVDGGGAGPVFTVAADTTVEMRRLTIANGQASSGSGANNSGNLTLQLEWLLATDGEPAHGQHR